MYIMLNVENNVFKMTLISIIIIRSCIQWSVYTGDLLNYCDYDDYDCDDDDDIFVLKNRYS